MFRCKKTRHIRKYIPLLLHLPVYPTSPSAPLARLPHFLSAPLPLLLHSPVYPTSPSAPLARLPHFPFCSTRPFTPLPLLLHSPVYPTSLLLHSPIYPTSRLPPQLTPLASSSLMKWCR